MPKTITLLKFDIFQTIKGLGKDGLLTESRRVRYRTLAFAGSFCCLKIIGISTSAVI